ncbi:MAG: FAD-binding oxidoreductase [Microbacterium sp.]|uniref:FAD-binding oxidoreductase n=1 Tax=Microbacterium sp. TaxID=51671 RepID=UPI0039E4CB56
MTDTTTLSSRAGALADALACEVVLPHDAEYDVLRRVWNADIDRYPAAIVRCRDASDVSAALRWCVEHGLPITVRGGGHNLAGTAVADDAVLIDTGLLRDIEFDTVAGTVTVGAGCRWGDVDRAAAPYDVAVPAGVVSHTGVAGLTLGGGGGYLSRMYGTTVDHVESIEVVVADGRILTADRDHHPDLFWALRGAGHNYGVATRFTYRYVPLPGLATVRQALFAAEDRRGLLEFFADWGPDRPANVGTYVRLMRAPGYWSQIPAEHRGQQIISVATVVYGDPADEPALTREIFAQAEPIYTSVRTIPHVTLQHATDDEFRYGVSHYWKHQSLSELTPAAIDVVLDHVDRYPGRSLNSSAFISHQMMCPFEMIAGSREPLGESDDSAVGIRGLFGANIGADWEHRSERAPLVAWAREFDRAMAPFRAGTYINFASDAGDDEVARAVYGDRYDRLVTIKAAYDPDNVFARGLVDLHDVGEDDQDA